MDDASMMSVMKGWSSSLMPDGGRSPYQSDIKIQANVSFLPVQKTDIMFVQSALSLVDGGYIPFPLEVNIFFVICQCRLAKY